MYFETGPGRVRGQGYGQGRSQGRGQGRGQGRSRGHGKSVGHCCGIDLCSDLVLFSSVLWHSIIQQLSWKIQSNFLWCTGTNKS